MSGLFSSIKSFVFRSAPAGAGAREQRILIICDGRDEHACRARDNALAALHYARLNVATWDLAGTDAEPSLGRYSSVLFCAEDLQALAPAFVQAVRAFVQGGGGLAVIYRGWHQGLCDVFGMAAIDDWPVFLTDEESEGGMSFEDDTLPGFAGLSFSSDDLTGHVAFDIAPLPEAKVFARNERGRALAWANTFGKGRVLFWNTAVLTEKGFRGLVPQSVACVQRCAVVPMANVALIHVDDFPPPWAHELYEPAATEFPGATTEEFYLGIWHEDMRALAAREGIAYTYFAIFDYARTANSFEPPVLEDRELAAPGFNWEAAKAVLSTAELGLHGLNHVPLCVDRWGSPEAMREAVHACRDLWRTWLSDEMPYSYVPPNNEYDAEGVAALAHGFPEIAVICNAYTGGTFARGGNRELGPEPWDDRLFSLPRATSGFEREIGHCARMISQVETMGLWTHMIHPDDIFDTPERHPDAGEWRNPLTRFWRAPNEDGEAGLFDTFAEWIAFAKAKYPWLRYMDTRKAVPILKAYLATEVDVRTTAATVEVDAAPGMHFRLRLNNQTRVNPAGCEYATLLDIDDHTDFAVYTFEMTGRRAVIEFI